MIIYSIILSTKLDKYSQDDALTEFCSVGKSGYFNVRTGHRRPLTPMSYNSATET